MKRIPHPWACVAPAFLALVLASTADPVSGAPDVLPASGSQNTWDAEWFRLPPPCARESHSLIYDPLRDRMLVFGGWAPDATDLSEVWASSLGAVPRWNRLDTSGLIPTDFDSQLAIYDPLRDRLLVLRLLYGQGEVWTLPLSGSLGWSLVLPAGTPPSARHLFSAIYDPIDDRVVIFGGSANSTSLNDVWSLSLAGTPEWSRMTPSGTPPMARTGHTAVYDPSSRRMVVFGGAGWVGGNILPRNDTWALSLGESPAWTQLLPSGTPPKVRRNHTATYDPVRQRMIVIGGHDHWTYHEVWALSLAAPAWTLLSSEIMTPSQRSGHAAIHDPVRDRIVVFGGWGYGIGNDAWAMSLDGYPAWTLLHPHGSPPSSLIQHTAIHDSLRDQMVVFGGVRNGLLSNATSTFALSDPNTWTDIETWGTPPAARSEHVAIHDRDGDRMIVFGGSLGSDSVQVWALALGAHTWSPVVTSGPQPLARRQASAIYDPVRRRMILFGGIALNGPTLDDAWSLSLGETPSWTRIEATGAQADLARRNHVAIYDPVGDRMIVHGGQGNYPNPSGSHASAWALSLSGAPSWVRIAPSSPGPATSGHTAVYDHQRHRMVVINSTEAWELTLAGAPAWRKLDLLGASPGPRSEIGVIHDPNRDRVVLCGGPSGDGDVLWSLGLAPRGVGVEEASSPSRLEFAPPRPNPARGEVVLDFTLPRATRVTLDVFDTSGRRVRAVADRISAAGRHRDSWDLRTDEGVRAACGVYFVRCSTPEASSTRRIVVIR